MALGKSPKGAHAAAAKEIGNPALEADTQKPGVGMGVDRGSASRYTLCL